MPASFHFGSTPSPGVHTPPRTLRRIPAGLSHHDDDDDDGAALFAADFGLARAPATPLLLAKTGTTMGHPGSPPPAQLSQQELDAFGDDETIRASGRSPHKRSPSTTSSASSSSSSAASTSTFDGGDDPFLSTDTLVDSDAESTFSFHPHARPRHGRSASSGDAVSVYSYTQDRKTYYQGDDEDEMGTDACAFRERADCDRPSRTRYDADDDDYPPRSRTRSADDEDDYPPRSRMQDEDDYSPRSRMRMDEDDATPARPSSRLAFLEDDDADLPGLGAFGAPTCRLVSCVPADDDEEEEYYEGEEYHDEEEYEEGEYEGDEEGEEEEGEDEEDEEEVEGEGDEEDEELLDAETRHVIHPVEQARLEPVEEGGEEGEEEDDEEWDLAQLSCHSTAQRGERWQGTGRRRARVGAFFRRAGF